MSDDAREGYADGTVSEVITTYVRPGREYEYQAWAERIHKAEAQFPGYRGGFLQPPASERQHCWTTLVRFAAADQLDAWLNSDERNRLLQEHNALVESWEHHRLPSSFAGWFAGVSESGVAPAVWKQSMLVILVLFPIVMLELRYLSPLLTRLNSSPATFVANVISVTLLAWPFMPLVIGRMKWWLVPEKNDPAWLRTAGVALILAIYAIEIALFSRI
jgi:antibiotic biosynthesis monooxygenase (ABM) superfamily enzyme